MKKIFLLSICLATLLSCSDNGIEPKKPEQEECSIVGLKGSDDVSISYDQNGKVSKIIDNSEGDAFRVTTEFQYSSKKITTKVTSLNNAVPSTENIEYLLDDSGKIISNTLGFTFNYNTQGYVNQIKVGSLTDQYTYSDDNLVMIKMIYGTYTETNNIEYDMKESYAPFTVDSESLGSIVRKVLYEQGSFGKKPKNRIKSYNNSSEGLTNFTYENDSKGKVVKISAKNDSEIDNLFLEYNCK